MHLVPAVSRHLSSGVPQQDSWTVTVIPGDAFTNIDFGAQALPGEIRGQKFHDLNGDGIKDPLEPGLSGWQIYIDANNNQQFDSGTETVVVTDSNGSFVFPNLPGGKTYIIAEVQQSGWDQSFPITNNGRHIVDLGGGETFTSADFGNGRRIGGSGKRDDPGTCVRRHRFRWNPRGWRTRARWSDPSIWISTTMASKMAVSHLK